MHDVESQIKTSLGVQLPENYLAFMKKYGEKLAGDPVLRDSWIPGLGDIFFVTGTTLAFRSKIPNFPKTNIIIGYAGKKPIEKINEEIDVYLMLNSRDGSLHLMDSLGVSHPLGKNFGSWLEENLRQVLLGERYSNRLVVIGFDDEREAGRLLSDLLRLQKNAMVDLGDAVVAVRDSEGKVKLEHMRSLTVRKTVDGSMVGLIVRSLLFLPLIGAALGAAAGTALTNAGIDDKFIDELAATLKPSSSALFVLARTGNPDELVKELRGRGGKVLVTTIGSDKAIQLQALLDLPEMPKVG